MRRPATALIMILALILFLYQPVLAQSSDLIQSLSSSLSQFSGAVSSTIQQSSIGKGVGFAFKNTGTVSTGVNFITSAVNGYHSWTQANRGAMPQMAAQWDHYTRNFGVAGAPLFVIGQVSNPVMSYITGVQPGSQGARDFGRGCNDILGGIVNVPTKVLLGRDLANPYAAPLRGFSRITAVTPTEGINYGLFVGAPAIAKAVHLAGFSNAVPAFIRPGTGAACLTWPTIGFAARAVAGPLFGEKIGSSDNLFNSGIFAGNLMSFAVFNYVAFSAYPYGPEITDRSMKFTTSVMGLFASAPISVFGVTIAGSLGAAAGTGEPSERLNDADSLSRYFRRIYGNTIKGQSLYHAGRIIAGL